MKRILSFGIKLRTVVALAALLTLSAHLGKAEILLAKTRTSPWVFGGASYLIGFSSAADTTHNFTTSQPNTRIVITFNAECMVGGGPVNWTDIDIVVDPAGAPGPVTVSPSDSDNAFCSGNDTPSDVLNNGGDGWVSAVTQTTMVVPTAGVHTVKVLLKNGFAGGLTRLDDMSLVVMK
jgi:hypothetical protein